MFYREMTKKFQALELLYASCLRETIGYRKLYFKHKRSVMVNMLWCDNAVNNQTGTVRMPTAKEVKLAIQSGRGHVITLVGYYPDSKQFIFRKSYGPTWGKQGYGITPERYVINFYEVCQKLKKY